MHSADARVITASDYTAVIAGVPAGVTDVELREWCSHYGSGGQGQGAGSSTCMPWAKQAARLGPACPAG